MKTTITSELEYLNCCTQIVRLKRAHHCFHSTGKAWLDKAQKDALASIIADLDAQVQEYIDQRVEEWHEGRGGAEQKLREYLGLSQEEYSQWVKSPSNLPEIVAAREQPYCPQTGLTEEDWHRAH